MTKKCFNLVDESWIPVVDQGLVGLRGLFIDNHLRALGGSPLHKIAVMKLLLAIAQAAYTPDDDKGWKDLGQDGLADACLAYLDQWQDTFWLYGDTPFLQMPSVAKAKPLPYGALLPDVASGNTSVLFQTQWGPDMTDALRAMILLVNMSCCLSGKKVDNTISLSPGYKKGASGEAGPALCSRGLLHSFLQGGSLRQTLWFNLMTKADIASMGVFPAGLGTPPWERMPQGEDCSVAKELRSSLMGRLVPLARFMLLRDENICYVGGLQHLNYLHGNVIDPSAAVDFTDPKKTRALWADPSKRPWRSLTSLLQFISGTPATSKKGYWCPLLKSGITRLRQFHIGAFQLWCGGIKLSSNAGEQYLTGSDDVVESEFSLSTDYMTGEYDKWITSFQRNMELLEVIGKKLYGAVIGYYKDEMVDTAGDHAAKATHVFWQQAERHAESLSLACSLDDPREEEAVMRRMLACALKTYDQTCPQATARQMQVWARHQPRFRLGTATAGKAKDK